MFTRHIYVSVPSCDSAVQLMYAAWFTIHLCLNTARHLVKAVLNTASRIISARRLNMCDYEIPGNDHLSVVFSKEVQTNQVVL